MRRVLAALLLSSAPVAADDVPPKADAALIPNYSVVNPGLAAGGQPTAEGLQQLKGMGFKTVINLRTEKEPGTREEEAAVTAAGLRYVSVPFTAETLTAQDVDKVAAVLADAASGPVLLHCGSSNRVGGVVALLELRKGKTLEEAEAKGRAAGLTSPSMVEAVKRVGAPRP
jgi:uncharacterized protein (TIGR01244 family)